MEGQKVAFGVSRASIKDVAAVQITNQNDVVDL